MVANTEVANQVGFIPTTVYSQGPLLFVHTGKTMQVIARVGPQVAPLLPPEATDASGMEWTQDYEAVAKQMAYAINAYPLQLKRMTALEGRVAAMAAKLKVAAEALRRFRTLEPQYVAALVQELDRTAAGVST